MYLLPVFAACICVSPGLKELCDAYSLARREYYFDRWQEREENNNTKIILLKTIFKCCPKILKETKNHDKMYTFCLGKSWMFVGRRVTSTLSWASTGRGSCTSPRGWVNLTSHNHHSNPHQTLEGLKPFCLTKKKQETRNNSQQINKLCQTSV